MKALVGYTGFVGSNLYEAGNFDCVYNSQNIEEAFGSNPSLLVYSGLRAEKYLANHVPEKDMALIVQAEENIKKIKPDKLVFISTIDVFKNPNNVNENTIVDKENLHAYGYNRYQMECWVRKNYPEALIIRLPGLFGKNIKKNFIYDFMNRIPFMLKEEKLKELLERDRDLGKFYVLQGNDFYKVKDLDVQERVCLKKKFEKLGFSALNFTDSRSIYQFYPLSRLWDDMQIALCKGIKLWHPATEPISASELYFYLTGDKFENELSGTPVYYNYKTIHEKEYGGENGYISGKDEIKKEIKRFLDEREKEK